MDLLDRLVEDHERIRGELDRVAAQITCVRDAQGFPAGWTVASEEKLILALGGLLPLLRAHELVEDELVEKPLVEAGQEKAAFRGLGADHKVLEGLVASLASVLAEEQERPLTWLVANSLKLIELLSEHMRREEYEVFPMVRATLTKKQLKELGFRAESLLRADRP